MRILTASVKLDKSRRDVKKKEGERERATNRKKLIKTNNKIKGDTAKQVLFSPPCPLYDIRDITLKNCQWHHSLIHPMYRTNHPNLRIVNRVFHSSFIFWSREAAFEICNCISSNFHGIIRNAPCLRCFTWRSQTLYGRRRSHRWDLRTRYLTEHPSTWLWIYSVRFLQTNGQGNPTGRGNLRLRNCHIQSSASLMGAEQKVGRSGMCFPFTSLPPFWGHVAGKGIFWVQISAAEHPFLSLSSPLEHQQQRSKDCRVMELDAVLLFSGGENMSSLLVIVIIIFPYNSLWEQWSIIKLHCSQGNLLCLHSEQMCQLLQNVVNWVSCSEKELRQHITLRPSLKYLFFKK